MFFKKENKISLQLYKLTAVIKIHKFFLPKLNAHMIFKYKHWVQLFSTMTTVIKTITFNLKIIILREARLSSPLKFKFFSYSQFSLPYRFEWFPLFLVRLQKPVGRLHQYARVQSFVVRPSMI